MDVLRLSADAIPLILPMAEAYVRTSQVPITFQPEKVLTFWRILYELERGELCGLFTTDAEMVGFIGVHVIESSFGEVAGANEWAWWVEPAYRKGRGGLRLLEWAEAWAKARGLGLSVGAYDVMDGDRMAHLYARRGYVRRGCIFTRHWEDAHV